MAGPTDQLPLLLAPHRERLGVAGFYVYEHWRPDLDVCFYVGKGKRGRAYKIGRNAAYGRVVETLAGLGMCVEVRMFSWGLTEADAFKIERKRIAFWRGIGVDLANRTDGGEGASGLIRPLGIRLSEDAKRKLSAARKGIKFSAEHRRKLALKKLGVKRRPFTDETRRKMRLASAKREAAKRAKFGANVRRTSRLKEECVE